VHDKIVHVEHSIVILCCFKMKKLTSAMLACTAFSLPQNKTTYETHLNRQHNISTISIINLSMMETVCIEGLSKTFPKYLVLV